MSFDVTALNDFLDEKAEPFLIKAVLKSKTIAMLNAFPGLKANTAIPTQDMDYDILQTGTCITTLKGSIVIAQRFLNPQRVKFLADFCIEDLEKKFFAQSLPAGSIYDGLDPQNAQFLNLIMSRIEAISELAIWHGEQGGADPIASLNIYDGILHTVDDEIAAATIPASQQIATGVINNTNAVTAVTTMRDALPSAIFDDVEDEPKWKLFVSGQVKQAYVQNYRATFTSLTPSARTLDGFVNGSLAAPIFVDGTAIEIVSVPGLTGTIAQNKMVLANTENMWYGFDVAGEETDMRVGLREFHEKIWVKSQWKSDFNFGKPEEIVVNNF